MPPARRPEFEPVFGSRSADGASASDRSDPSGEVGRPGQVAGQVADPRGAADVGRADTPAIPLVEPEHPVPEAVEVVEAVEAVEASAMPTLPARPHAEPPPLAAPAPGPLESNDRTPTDGAPRPKGLRWFHTRQRIVAACAIAVLVAVAYYLVSLFQVWTTGRAHDDGPVDAIVVMGAAQYDGRPSPQLAARLDHVVELWPEGIAPLVVVTGGNIPGDRFTEAEASATYLTERGVPMDALLLENAGSNSYESLEAVAAMLDARGLHEVLIVTDPYHALRSRLIAEEVGLDASVSSTDTSVVTGGESMKRHFEEAAGVAVGRIIGFDRLTALVD